MSEKVAHAVQKRFVSWPKTPLPGVEISYSGLLVLADLSTIAKRTALTGTATWMDVLLLAPGIAYQQRAESLGTSNVGKPPDVTNLNTGAVSKVTNTATVHYLQRIGDKGRPVVLDVGGSHPAISRPVGLGQRGRIFQSEVPSAFRLSTLLYIGGPVMTIVAMILMILTQDWWGLSLILLLMLSRAINVWIIRQRTKEVPETPKTENAHENWWIVLGDNRSICLRGLAHDLAAITTGEWMRAKTIIEGYLEAMAKLIVFMVGILSGNVYQTGDIIFIILLLSSAGLLALSNAHTSTFNMNGRMAEVTGDTLTDAQKSRISATLTETSSYLTGPMSGMEKSEVTTAIASTYPFSDEAANV